MQQIPPGVTLNLCWGLVAQPAESVIYRGHNALGNGPCCWGGFQRTWYEAISQSVSHSCLYEGNYSFIVTLY